MGHEVYDFREPKPGYNGFSWRQVHPEWTSWTPEQWRDALRHPASQNGYTSDRGGMDWADIGVLVLPCGRSAHLEAGFMAGRGKPVLTLAFEKTDPDLMNLLLGPPENICTNMPELFNALDRLKGPKLVVEIIQPQVRE